MLVLHSEPALASKSSELHVQIRNDEGQSVLDRTKALDGAQSQLARIPLVPKGDDPTRRFVATAELLDAAGMPLAKLEARSGYKEHALYELHVWFEDACAGVECEPGRTCQGGACVGSCFVPREVGSIPRAKATCAECETCATNCSPASGLRCGCPGETCASGSCTPLKRVAHVSSGDIHTCAALDTNDVYCWGSTMFPDNLGSGRLGTGSSGQNSPLPVQVPGATGQLGIAASGNHTCSIGYATRYCWGLNFEGELGGAQGSIRSDPERFVDPNLGTISSGFRHTCGGGNDTTELWCWGYNERGNLGLGHKDVAVRVPTLVGTGYVASVARGDHTCAIRTDGTLLCWGYNESGELGAPIGVDSAEGIRSGCDATNLGDACFQDWARVGAGAYHTCAIRKNGHLYCWGGNLNGQLGIGPPTSDFNRSEPTRVAGDVRWADVAGGRSHTCALSDRGELYCWGLNEDGQLGISSADSVSSPMRVETKTGGGWRAIAPGERHTCAIRSDRTLWCWGRNSEGQVGPQTTDGGSIKQPRRVCF